MPTKVSIDLLANQMEVAASKARMRVMFSGRRWGKTLTLSAIAIKYACDNAKSLIWWCTPVISQGREAYDFILRIHGIETIVDFKKTALNPVMRITLKNRSVIEFRSTEVYNNLRGGALNLLVLDEIRDMRAEAWHAALRPKLMDTGGLMIGATTPIGKAHFSYTDFWKRRGEKDEFGNPLLECWKFPATQNPFVPPQEFEELRKTMPEHIYRQEILAEFLDSAYGVFVEIEAHEKEIDPTKLRGPFVVGVDWGQARDYTGIVVLDCCSGHTVFVDRYRRVKYDVLYRYVAEVAEKFKAAYIVADASGTQKQAIDPLRTLASCRVIPFLATNTRNNDMVNHAVVLWDGNRLTIPPGTVLSDELAVLQLDVSEQGTMKYVVPSSRDGHGDVARAWLYATTMLRERRMPGSLKGYDPGRINKTGMVSSERKFFSFA